MRKVSAPLMRLATNEASPSAIGNWMPSETMMISRLLNSAWRNAG